MVEPGYIIGSDIGLSPGRRQAITWTNVGILLIWLLGTNFNEILIEIYTLSVKKMHLKVSSGNSRPFCLALNVITGVDIINTMVAIVFSNRCCSDCLVAQLAANAIIHQDLNDSFTVNNFSIECC